MPEWLEPFVYALGGGLVGVRSYIWTKRKLRGRHMQGTGIPWPHGTGIPANGVQVYRCPTHGLIESPTWHEDEIQEDSGYYCPINLTGKDGAPHDGITDDVCGKDVSGPYFLRSDAAARSIAFREEQPNAD